MRWSSNVTFEDSGSGRSEQGDGTKRAEACAVDFAGSTTPVDFISHIHMLDGYLVPRGLANLARVMHTAQTLLLLSGIMVLN